MSTILWVRDSTTDYNIGGASLSDKYWVKLLADNGYSVDRLHIQNQDKYNEVKILGYDLIICTNTDRISKVIINSIIKHPHYFVILHGTLSGEPVLGFYSKAEKLIGMSPSHAKWIRDKYKHPKVEHYAPYIPEEFIATYKRSKREYLYVGTLIEHKGIKGILKYAAKSQIHVDFYGSGNLANTISSHPNGSSFPEISPKDVPYVMNKYNTFIWHLQRYGSYGRTILEALLCGMELDVNKDNFGVFSYKWSFNDPKELRKDINREYERFLGILSK